MAQQSIQSSRYNFAVEAVPSYMALPSGEFVKDGFTLNRRVDTLAVLGKVTDRYGIVQNTELLEAAETTFASKGLANFSRSIVVTGEGEKMYAVYDFPSHTRALKVGDEVSLRLTVQNSFNGELRASLVAGIKRLVCKNGLTSMGKEVGLTKKHGSKVSVSFVEDALTKAISAWDSSLTVFERMSEVSITQMEGANILERLKAGNVISGKLLENIAAIWAAPTYREDEARNLFNLYNAVTQHLTHGVEAERFELANRVSSNVLAMLNRAAYNPANLAKLVATVANTAIVTDEI